MDILLVAWRYLIARPINLVSMSSVMVGLAAIVVVDSVMNGFLGQQRTMIRALAPDVTIERGDLDAAAFDAIRARVAAEPDVRGVSARLEVPCIYLPMHEAPQGIGLPGISGNFFVEVLGLDPDDERKVVDLDPFLQHDRCEYLSDPTLGTRRDVCTLQVRRVDRPFEFSVDDPEWQGLVDPEYRYNDNLIPLVLGERLAGRCRLAVGNVISVLTQKPIGDGETIAARSRLFVIVGTFVALDPHYEVTHALAPRAPVADFAGVAAAADRLAVAGRAGTTPIALRERLRADLADVVAPARIVSWTDQKGLLLGAVENERKIMNVAMFFVVVVATFSLFMTLHQMVRLKTRDLGVLSAMGSSPGRAGRLFLLCGGLVTLAGTVLGIVVGLALTHWLNVILDAVHAATGFRLFDPSYFAFRQLPTQIDPQRIAWYVLGTVVCGTLFTLLPSLYAARLVPVEALRDE